MKIQNSRLVFDESKRAKFIIQNYGLKGFTRTNFWRNLDGFTLVEVVLAAGLAIIIGTLLIAILVQNNGFFYKQNTIISEGLNLNDFTREINQYIRQAVMVAAEYIDESTTYTSDAQTLVLKLPALNSDGIIENTYDFVVVAKDPSKNNILRLKVFPNPQSSREQKDLVLTNLLQTNSFKYLDKAGNQVLPESSTSVESTLSVLSKTGSIESSRTSSVTVSLRNTSL